MNKKWSEQGIEPGWIVQLKSVAEKTCDSSIELVDKWPNAYDWGIDL